MKEASAGSTTTQRGPESEVPKGSQTLIRGLSLIEAVADGVADLASLVRVTGLTRSTAHRLLSALAATGYLRYQPSDGYSLGSKLIQLGFKAHADLHLPKVARPHLEALSRKCHDTVHLAVLVEDQIAYVDRVAGQRGLQMAAQIGSRLPVQTTALGKALLADVADADLAAYFRPGMKRTEHSVATIEAFRLEVEKVRKLGYSTDLEENEIGIRCVAAPIRDGGDQIIAALSVSSALPFMDEARMTRLACDVMTTAEEISRELGWIPS